MAQSGFDTLAGNALFFSDELRAMRAQVRRFVKNEIKPQAAAWEEAGFVPRMVLRQMGALGFFGMRYPEVLGGSGMDQMASVVLAEELGRSTFAGVAITALVHTDMASVHIFNAGTQAQKERWLPPMIAGEAICAVAVTEPGAGSDVRGLRTTARRNDDHFILNGAKMFITNGVHGDVYCVAARTSGAPGSSAGVTMFIVEAGTPGFTVSRALDKHGWRSSDTAELSFADCAVPAENMLGQEGRGFYEIMKNFQNERLVLGAMMMGEAQAALELTLDYLRQ